MGLAASLYPFPAKESENQYNMRHHTLTGSGGASNRCGLLASIKANAPSAERVLAAFLLRPFPKNVLVSPSTVMVHLQINAVILAGTSE